MHLGNEIFDVCKTTMHSDHNHMFIKQGSVLHGQTVFRSKLSFRPHSIHSATHKKLIVKLVEHGSSTKKVTQRNALSCHVSRYRTNRQSIYPI